MNSAYALIRDQEMSGADIKLWCDADDCFTNVWGPQRGPVGLALGRVGRMDGEDLAAALGKLLLVIEHRLRIRRGFLTSGAGAGALVDAMLGLSSAATLLGEARLALSRWLERMPPGRTPDHDIEDDT